MPELEPRPHPTGPPGDVALTQCQATAPATSTHRHRCYFLPGHPPVPAMPHYCCCSHRWTDQPEGDPDA